MFIAFSLGTGLLSAQLPVARDTITVIEQSRTLKMPWAGGINSANVSNADLNFDGKQDLVFFDKVNLYGYGTFRCFIADGGTGTVSYRSDPGLGYFFPKLSNWVVMRDYDGDGRADIFCSTVGGIKVFRNESSLAAGMKFVLAKELLESNYYPDVPNTIPSNLYAGVAGAPGIADVDGDEDLDVLTFTPLGVYLELHRNMSRELYGHSDSLVFEREDPCWGNLSENGCAVDFEACTSKLSSPRNDLHAGSCIACLDSDGDADMDLIMGDIGCSFVHYVHNAGTAQAAHFNDTTKLYPNYPNKNSNNSYIMINHFPCAYPVDVDHDGRTDLVATPNVTGAENAASVWLYRNSSTTATVDLQLDRKNFLQDEMIEVGQGSFPLLIDENGDGLKDLLVGSTGMYTAGKLTSALTLYRNTGSASQPVFSLVTRDYGSLVSSSLNGAMPSAGDIDGDGDTDICIGTQGGQIHWLENTAGAGQPIVTAPLRINPFQFTTQSAAAAPQLFDLDGDGKTDLLIGMKNGRVAFYRNTTSGSLVTFSLVTSQLGGIDVKADPAMYGLDAYAVPCFYREGNSTFALVGSVTGEIKHYSVPSATADFQLLNAAVNGLREGSQSTVWYEDINADGKRDLFVGSAAGGLSFFSSASPFVGIAEVPVTNALICHPNPASTLLYLRVADGGTFEEISVTDITGRVVLSLSANPGNTLDISQLPSGVYFIQCRTLSGFGVSRASARFVKNE